MDSTVGFDYDFEVVGGYIVEEVHASDPQLQLLHTLVVQF